ncbi:hypothetical protein KVT40_000448 [Elsinoe batatas]|uniref:FAD-binding PCMH-type domain-containing protein n=1 Tax=Elsinoe batatas TaxID=2601811 RepID=A0A8K0LAZ2_9PEZI|nr:hypothetical protein KVT40_000448 [Elsinoe batatas]
MRVTLDLSSPTMRSSFLPLLALLSSASAEHLLEARQEDLAAQLAIVQTGARITPARATCEVLRLVYLQYTSFNGSVAYTEDNTNYWTAASALGPACIFAPDRPEAMSSAVLLLWLSRVPFAVRGGGHMPIGDFNNIDARGVLLSTTALRRLALTPSKTSINVGPGNRWRDVYNALEPHGLAVVGGRVGPVGVPGFILGGGVSYFGQQRGWAVNNVASIQVVLADGRLVTASARGQYSDLFWALKGGGNSFGIVTNVELQAFPAPALTIGDQVYGGDDVKNKWFDAIVNQAIYGSQDEKHAVTPIANRRPLSTGDTISYSSALFYSEDNNKPKVLKNWTAPNLIPIAGNVFGGYAAGSLQRLKQIRNKYDPSRLLTDQLVGGWKVDRR